jgi:hypothetical protein
MNLLNSPLFYCKNKDTYPPFKNGLYLEEYFLQFIKENYNDLSLSLKRKYIPILWTNFQIEGWFPYHERNMQQLLNEWVINNPSPTGYFTVVQHDDACRLKLPNNTIIYGSCSGDIPIPLIYEDVNNTLINIPKKSFKEKTLSCSFVGNITSNAVLPNVRRVMMDKFSNNPKFKMIDSGGWTAIVKEKNQKMFIDITVNSKFAFAPRGYGRSSFRFFECFQLGTIPIYIWNDKNWLPFQDVIDYNKLCICIHISEIDNLEKRLESISEKEYVDMFSYYEKIKHLFTLNGMSRKIIEEVNML